MNFWLKIKSSIYDPEFYRSIPKESLQSALQYYLLFCVVITLLRMAFLLFPITTGITAIAQGINQEVTKFPTTLQVRIHNGHATATGKQPYTFPLCDTKGNCANLVIDTRNVNTSKYIKQGNVDMLLTKDTLFFKETTDDVRSYPLSNFNDITINKQILTNFVQKLLPWVKFIIPGIIVLSGIILYVGYLFKLIYFFLLALFIWLFAKRFVPGMKYKQAYKLSLHAVTLGIFVTLLIDVVGKFFNLYAFPFMETFLAIMVVIINVNTGGTKLHKTTETKKRGNL